MLKKSCTIWINGRFLSRKVTGVERVAHELLRALDENYLDDSASCEMADLHLTFKIAAPPSSEVKIPTRVGRIPVQIIGSLSGHAWEQWSLSRWAGDDWLLNLCNTAPLFRRRQSVFFHDAQVFAIPGNFDWKFRLWYRALLNIAGRRAQSLFTNSNFSQSELSKYTGINPGKILVVHLGADHMLRLTPSISDEMRARLPGEPFLLAVSSASPNKNFGAVVKAIQILGDKAPPCVFVGQKYAKVFSDLELDASLVTELGYVSDENLAALYDEALCLVYPSIYEGFGLPPVEAMTFGTPVIASNTSSLPEVCANGALYCDPLDPKSLAGMIERLQTDPAARMAIGSKGMERARLFSWKVGANKILGALASSVRTTA